MIQCIWQPSCNRNRHCLCFQSHEEFQLQLLQSFFSFASRNDYLLLYVFNYSVPKKIRENKIPCFYFCNPFWAGALFCWWITIHRLYSAYSLVRASTLSKSVNTLISNIKFNNWNNISYGPSKNMIPANFS